MDMDAFYAAAIAGDADAISKFEMRDDRFKGKYGNILHDECFSGNLERVRFILSKFASENLLVQLNSFNGTVLLGAVIWGHTEVVKFVIDTARHFPWASLADNNPHDNQVTSFQAFLRQPDDQLRTALHWAIRGDGAPFVDIFKLLVEADPSDRHTSNKEGKTPIYMAAEKGLKGIVELICTTCGPQSLDGPAGSTALHVLIKDKTEVKEEHIAMMRIIINAVKRWSSAEDSSKNTLEELFNRTDESGRNVLDLAVVNNNLEATQLILFEDRAYVCGSKKHDLMRLIFKVVNEDNKDFIELLSRTYQAGIDSCHEGIVDLILAMKKRDKAYMLQLLEANKLLVSFADDQGWTALHYAAYFEFDGILDAIIDVQKNAGYQFEFGDMVTTPFHVAAEMGHTSTLILLMQLWPISSSAYTSQDKNGHNILHLTAQKNKKDMIQNILKYCPEEYTVKILNQQDLNGDTPLHLLVFEGCFVSQLMKHKALDTMVKNKKNWTPRDMLYSQDEIIADQVQIKIALDKLQTIHERDNLDSPVLPSKRKIKDEKFKKCMELLKDEKNAQMKLDLERYKRTRAIAHWFPDAMAGDAVARAALEMEADTVYEEGKTMLHVESMRGNIERVRYILREFEKKNLLDKLDTLKQSALHLAAQHGHTQVVEVLIDAARHLPSYSANDGDTYNPVPPFQAFIRQANVPNRNTALHLAVLNGYVAIVKLIIQADPNDSHVKNNEGKTPIYIAAENGNIDIVKEICVACTTMSLDGHDGRTTVLHALIQNMGEVTEGVTNVIRMMVNAAKLWSGTEFKALFIRTDESESTVLQLAMKRNYVDAVELLLQEDPAYQHGPEFKRNSFMRLIFKAIDNKYSDDIIKLLSQTYEVGISPDHKDVVALILAMKRRDEDTVLRLLGGARDLVTFTDDHGWTPLHYAVYHDFDLILGAIIEAQEDVGHQFVYGNMVQTPFHVAVKCGYPPTLILLMQLWPTSSSELVDANSPYTAIDEKGQNILHQAAAENKKEMVQGILKYCPEKYKDTILKQQDFNGDTPLHILTSRGCFIPELINYKGLDTMVKNNNEYTPRDMLYLKNEIVADQVHIKIALDDVDHESAGWNLWAKSKEKKMDIKKSKVPPSKRRIKDVIFDERKILVMEARHEQMKKEVEKYKTRTNTQIIVTALITTVTFTVGFTMPGGLRQSGEVDEGSVILTRKAIFNAFMVSDALALLLSTCSLFLYFLESMYEDPRQVSKLNDASVGLNIVSVMAMMLTFITGTYLVLSHSPALAISVCVIGSFFFIFVIILLIKFVYDRKVKRFKMF